MTVNELLNALKLSSLPVAHLSNSLLTAVKNCDQQTRNTFFSSEPVTNSFKYAETYRKELKEFATKLICYTISKNIDFGFNNTVKQMDNRILSDWFAKNSAPVGGAFMLNYLENRLGKELDTSAEFVSAFAAQLMRDEYIAGLFIEAATVPTTLTGKLTLITLRQIDRSGEYFERVLNKWREHEQYQKFFGDYDTYPWLDCASGQFLGGEDSFNIVKGFSSGSCSRKTTEVRSVRKVIDTTVSGAPIMGYVSCDFDIYGANVVNWLKDIASSYSLTTGQMPNNEFDRGKHSSGGGCVLGNAKILMADGSEKEILAIEPGDLVFSLGGGISVTSREMVVNPHVGRYYSINDDDPFMSPEHPILSQTGWRCLNPQLAMEMTPHLEVSLLSVGDIVCKVKGYNYAKNTIEYENVVVERINLAEIDEIGYDLHFSDGYKSYHANGYCCMLNYPDITAQSVQQNLFGTGDERQLNLIKKQVDEMTPFLEQMFGKSAVSHTKNLLDNPIIRVEPALNPFITTGFADKSFLFSEIIFDEAPFFNTPGRKQGQNNELEAINIIKGNVYLGGEDPVFADQVSFNPQEEAVYFTKGNSLYYLKLLYNGLLAKGGVLEGGQVRTFTAYSNIRYPLSYQDRAGGESKPFAWFRMWFEQTESGSSIPVAGLFTDTNTSKMEDSVADRCVFSMAEVEKQYFLGVDISVRNDMYQALQDFGVFFFHDLKLHFTLDYQYLSGIGVRPDDEYKYLISGKYEEYEEQKSLKAKLSSHLLTKRPLADNFHNSRALHLPQEAEILRGAAGLSVEDLYCITKPENLSDIHDMNYNKVRNMMLYAIPDDWRAMIQQSKPTVGLYGDISEQERDWAMNDPEINQFLVNSFGRGYFTTAFSQSTESVISDKFKKFDRYEQKLDYYWKGIDDEKCFSKEKAYSKITNTSYLNCYLSFVPRLRYYKEDDAEAWAKKLYEYTLNPVILQGLAFESAAAHDKSHLHHITTMLDILDNRQIVEISSAGEKVLTSYSNALYYKVLAYTLGNSTGSVNSLDIENLTENDMQEIIENYFRQYYLALINGESFHGVNWSDDLRNQLLKELNEYMTEYHLNTVDDFVYSLASFSIDFARFLTSVKDLNLSAFRTFAGKYPKITKSLSYALSFTYFAMAGVAIFYAIFQGKDFSVTDWVQFAVSNVVTVAYAFNSFAVYKAAKTLLNLESTMPEVLSAIRTFGEVNDSIDILAMGVKQAGGLDNVILYLGVELSEEVAANSGQLLATAARWAKIAKVAGAVLKVVTVVAMAAALAFSIYQTIIDFSRGESTAIKVLQIIETVSTGIVFLIEAGTGIAALASVSVCSVIPIVGCAIMIIGLIVMIVLAFLPRKREETQAEKYVDTHSKSFLEGLKVPTEAWLKQQQDMTDHLEGTPNSRSMLFAYAF